MPTPLPVDLTHLHDDIQRAYKALTREQFGSLTTRQRQRLDEIHYSMERLTDAVTEYKAGLESPDALPNTDPRYRLMYAARTPMEMVLQCAYFLHINSMRKTEPLNPDQLEAVWLMERSGRKLVLEVERLWEEMRTEA